MKSDVQASDQSRQIAPSRITIGVMTRNYAKYLPCALDSILAQDMADWEVVIADDASTDDTATVVQPYLKDPRIRYVRHQTPLGQGGNWRFCLEWGTAPIVAVLHADDSYLPGTLRWALETMEARPEVDFAYGNCIRVKEVVDESGNRRILERIGWCEPDGELPTVEGFVHLMRTNHPLPSTSFIRREVLEVSGMPDSQLKMMVDVEFFRRLALASRRIAWTNNTVTRYLEHAASTTSKSSANGVFLAELSDFSKTLRLNIAMHGLQSRVPTETIDREFHIVERNAGGFIFRTGVSQAIEGGYRRSCRLAVRGLGIFPTQMLRLNVLVDLALILLYQRWLLRALHWKRVRGVIGDEVSVSTCSTIEKCSVSTFNFVGS